MAEGELEKADANLGRVLSTLTYARDVGGTNAEEVDEYLYGASE